MNLTCFRPKMRGK